jgi:hypothetical protein
LFASVIQIKVKRAELASRLSEKQTRSGEVAVRNDKFGIEGRKMQTVFCIGFRIRIEGQKKGGLRVGNVRQEGGIVPPGKKVLFSVPYHYEPIRIAISIFFPLLKSLMPSSTWSGHKGKLALFATSESDK